MIVSRFLLSELTEMGVLVIGCYGGNNEADRRMLRLFDEVLETLVGEWMAEGSLPEVVVSAEALAVIRHAIDQSRKYSDDFTRNRTFAFVRSRLGLARPVDSRLLFLTSRFLSRELTESDKIVIRHEFRVTLR